MIMLMPKPATSNFMKICKFFHQSTISLWWTLYKIRPNIRWAGRTGEGLVTKDSNICCVKSRAQSPFKDHIDTLFLIFFQKKKRTHHSVRSLAWTEMIFGNERVVRTWKKKKSISPKDSLNSELFQSNSQLYFSLKSNNMLLRFFWNVQFNKATALNAISSTAD